MNRVVLFRAEGFRRQVHNWIQVMQSWLLTTGISNYKQSVLYLTFHTKQILFIRNWNRTFEIQTLLQQNELTQQIRVYLEQF